MRSVVPLLLALALSGCLAQAPAPPDVARAVADTPALAWAPGWWWSYHARVGNATLDVALVVHERAPQGGVRLGTNVSAGFFGLPFHGNVSRELNPQVGAEEWPLYRFPLADGKSWDYELLGYEATTVARAAMVDVPGLGPMPGFTLESTSYGQVFARYDYSPVTGWFTRLELISPTKGPVLEASLTGYGAAYGQGYYVERVLREVRVDYPAVPGSVEVEVPGGHKRVEAHLTVETSAGAVEATLHDAAGYPLAEARGVGKGAETDRASSRSGAARHWVLEHRGAGAGVVHLVVTGLVPVGAPQATRPFAPQDGQVTVLSSLLAS